MAARIVVHSLDHARAALAAAVALDRAVTLASAAGAGIYAGPSWFKALTEEATGEFPAVRCDSVVDCGAAPGIALAALQLGLKRVRLAGDAEALRRLRSIAAQLGAVVETDETPALDLRGVRHPEGRCRAWLAGETMTRA